MSSPLTHFVHSLLLSSHGHPDNSAGDFLTLTDTCHPEAMSMSVCLASSNLDVGNKLIMTVSCIGSISLCRTPTLVLEKSHLCV